SLYFCQSLCRHCALLSFLHDALPIWTGWTPSASASPSAVMTSWPSSAAAGSRQELIEVQRVPPSASGRAIMIAQAPHSPSAQPCLAAVRPWPRRKSRAFMYVGPSNSRVSPLTETSAIERSVVVADIAFTSCASSLRRTMHGWSACYVLRDFWLSMRTAVKNIVVSPAAGLAAHGDVLIPRVRSAPSARL